jgi:hypothetical protein
LSFDGGEICNAGVRKGVFAVSVEEHDVQGSLELVLR